jgi:hypothetical protein
MKVKRIIKQFNCLHKWELLEDFYHLPIVMPCTPTKFPYICVKCCKIKYFSDIPISFIEY